MISKRLDTYQTQMSIYAEQHKIILASDVLDMIEQLQDDLKDDIDKVVEQLNVKHLIASEEYELDEELMYCVLDTIDDAIEIVKGGGKE